MPEWLTVEVLDGEVPASAWRRAHETALVEAAITNGASFWDWQTTPWGRGPGAAVRLRRPAGALPRAARGPRRTRRRPGPGSRPDGLPRARRGGGGPGAPASPACPPRGGRRAARAGAARVRPAQLCPGPGTSRTADRLPVAGLSGRWTPSWPGPAAPSRTGRAARGPEGPPGRVWTSSLPVGWTAPGSGAAPPGTAAPGSSSSPPPPRARSAAGAAGGPPAARS